MNGPHTPRAHRAAKVHQGADGAAVPSRLAARDASRHGGRHGRDGGAGARAGAGTRAGAGAAGRRRGGGGRRRGGGGAAANATAISTAATLGVRRRARVRYSRAAVSAAWRRGRTRQQVHSPRPGNAAVVVAERHETAAAAPPCGAPCAGSARGHNGLFSLVVQFTKLLCNGATACRLRWLYALSTAP